MDVWVQPEDAVSIALIAWLWWLLSSTEPVSMAPPSVSPLSPYSLKLLWERPADNVTRGKVVGYDITMVSEESPQQSIPVVFSQVLLFSTNVLSELNYVLILILSEFAESSGKTLSWTFL